MRIIRPKSPHGVCVDTIKVDPATVKPFRLDPRSVNKKVPARVLKHVNSIHEGKVRSASADIVVRSYFGSHTDGGTQLKWAIQAIRNGRVIHDWRYNPELGRIIRTP
jgi:hypothetical protein